MQHELAVGTVLLAHDAAFPRTLLPASARHEGKWVSLDPSVKPALEASLAAAGWRFFFVAGRLTATVLGLHLEAAVRRATQRLVSSSAAGRFNGLEITSIVSRRVLGLYRVSVTGYARHIQQSTILLRYAQDGLGGGQTRVERATDAKAVLRGGIPDSSELGRWEGDGGATAPAASPA